MTLIKVDEKVGGVVGEVVDCDALSVTASVQDGVLLVRCAGLLSLASLVRMNRALGDKFGGGFRAAICDVSRAAVAIPAAAPRGAGGSDCYRKMGWPIPVAYLASEWSYPVLAGHVPRAAEAGLTRRVFLARQSAAAHAWVARELAFLSVR